MRKLVKGPSVVAACLLLSGCPQAVRVEGTVTARTGAFLMSRQVQAGDFPPAFLTVNVDARSSITLRDGTCERTYRADFLMPQRLSCDDRDRQDDPQDDDDGEERRGQDQPAAERQAPEPGTSPRDSGQAPPGGQSAGGSALSGPQPPAPAGMSGPNVLTVASDLATVLGALIVANEIRKEIRDEDKPLSR